MTSAKDQKPNSCGYDGVYVDIVYANGEFRVNLKYEVFRHDYLSFYS